VLKFESMVIIPISFSVSLFCASKLLLALWRRIPNPVELVMVLFSMVLFSNRMVLIPML